MGLGTKLALAVGLLVAAATLLTSTAAVVSTTGQVNANIDRFLEERASDIASGIRTGPGRRGESRRPGQTGQVNGAEIRSAVEDDAEVQLLDQEGAIVASTGVTLPVDDVDIELARRQNPDVLRTVQVDGTRYRIITTHISGTGAIQIGRSLTETNRLLNNIQRRVLVIGLLASAVAAAIGWWISRSATGPLRNLTSSVESVAATGDLSTTIELDRPDEIGRLASSFGTMLSALDRSQRQQHQLVQDAAHELRTPLTSIQANVDLLAHAPDLQPELRNETISAMRSELHQLNAVFTEIIELATDSRETSPHRELPLADIVRTAAANLGPRSDHRIDVVADRSLVFGNEVELDRAVSNLIGNAQKFSPAGSTISIDVADGAVTVRDQGPGLQPGDDARIFDRFYRAIPTQSLPGSGLGLAIVKKVVADHNGQVFARNSPDGGAEVGFRLPPIT